MAAILVSHVPSLAWGGVSNLLRGGGWFRRRRLSPPSPTAINPSVRPLGTFKANMATLNRKRYILTILQKK